MVLANGQFRVIYSPQDYEAAVAFYRDGLGLSVDHDWDFGGGDRGIVFIAGGGMVELISLLPGQEYVKPQGIGLLIQVDDADRWFKLAGELALNVVQEPTSYPWGQRIVRLADPDGIVVSLFSPV